MDAPTLPPRGPRLARWTRPAAFLPLLLLLAVSLSLWYARFRLPGADEGALLTNAMKLIRGGLFYRDVDAYPFPLATYLLAGWMALFGEHLGVSRGLAVVFYALAVASLYACALRILGRERAALFGLSLLAFKLLAWPSFTSFVYWDVSFSLACAAVALLLAHRFDGDVKLPAAAGGLAGLALLAKQSLGIYLVATAAACLLFAGPLWAARRSTGQALREAGAFGAGAAAPVLAAAAYFGFHGLLGAMLESGLVRPFTGYLPSSGMAFSPPLLWWHFGELRGQAAAPYFAEAVWVPLVEGYLPGRAGYPAFWTAAELFFRALYSSVPIAFLGVAVLWYRARRAGTLARHRPTLLLGVLAVPILLSAFPRADYAHVIGVYPLLWLLLFALWAVLENAVGRWQRVLSAAQALGVGALLAVCGIYAFAATRALDRHVRLERADVWIRPEKAWVESLVRYIDEETKPGEAIFVYGQEADLYFLSGRLFPWPFAQLYPGQTGDADGGLLLARIRSAQPRLVLRGMMSWPGLPPISSYVPRVEGWVSFACERVEDVFEREPLPEGASAPPWWVLSVLRPCDWRSPCRTFSDFMKDAPVPWETGP